MHSSLGSSSPKNFVLGLLVAESEGTSDSANCWELLG